MRTLSTKETRARFSDVLGSVFHTGRPVAVERKGKRVAVIVSPEIYEQMQRQRQQIADRFGQAVADLHEQNRDKTEADVVADVNRAVAEVRRARRADTAD